MILSSYLRMPNHPSALSARCFSGSTAPMDPWLGWTLGCILQRLGFMCISCCPQLFHFIGVGQSIRSIAAKSVLLQHGSRLWWRGHYSLGWKIGCTYSTTLLNLIYFMRLQYCNTARIVHEILMKYHKAHSLINIVGAKTTRARFSQV